MSDPVVVVGAGPTGLVAALLLARRGVAVTVLERRTGGHTVPRAVHLDDESVRILQAAGVASEFAAISRAAAGLRLMDARLRPFAEFRRSERGVHGWPESNLFDQPDLEALLRDRVGAEPLVMLREGVDVVGVDVSGATAGGVSGPVGVRLVSGERVAAAAVLGCDGAHSTVRASLGARMRDLGFTERWFVVDVRAARVVSGWGGVDQVCDPARAATFVDLPGDRYRWEFRMHAGEDAADLAARVPELVARWSPGPVEVLRAGEYTFAARVADRWSDGRTFLLGDAAHLTPPFIGQGLGAGLRDAHNLAWKLAADLQGAPGPRASGSTDRRPDTTVGGGEGVERTAWADGYHGERGPHVEAMIRGAVRVGRAMTGGPGAVAALRRPLVAGALRIPAVRRRAAAGLATRFGPGPLVDRRRGRRDPVGTICPQPWPGHDALLGDGWALLAGSAPIPADLARRATDLDARTVRTAEPDLLRWLAAGRAAAVLLRPDRVVAATAPA